ncbi:MAG: hypothetical protein OEV73_09000 [Desulfobulbaceae bacterium]|nr:hypothetical protein [Desulfobulbaceae bacterium]
MTIKHYHYITKDKTTPEMEFWVCEDCRKRNINFILEGKWRLIGKQIHDEISCHECRGADPDAAGLDGGVPHLDTDTPPPVT